MNRATNQHFNAGLDRGLSLLSQSLTGYDWAHGREFNHDALKHYTTVGRELRAQAFRQTLRRVGLAVTSLVVGAVRALKHRQVRRTGIRELAALDDHQLKDIGVFRAEIPAVVDKALRNQLQPAVEPQSKVVTIAAAGNPANDDGSKLAA